MSDDLEELLQRGFRFAFSLTHNESEAEDLVQSACLKVLKAEGPWHKGYFFTTIRNAFYDGLRKSEREPTESLDASEPGGESAELDEEWRILAKAELERAMERLRPVEREALFLAAVEGYTAQEIADLTERPRGTVLSLIHRAKKKMAAYLDQPGVEVQS